MLLQNVVGFEYNDNFECWLFVCKAQRTYIMFFLLLQYNPCIGKYSKNIHKYLNILYVGLGVTCVIFI